MGTKRPSESFGADTSDMSKGAVSSGRIPNYGANAPKPNTGPGGDAKYSLTDEPKGGKKRRPVRAWGYLPRASLGGLMQDHGRGSKAERQNYNTGEVACEEQGGNTTGRVMKPVQPYIVDEFQGRSGQPDNQDVFRRKGST